MIFQQYKVIGIVNILIILLCLVQQSITTLICSFVTITALTCYYWLINARFSRSFTSDDITYLGQKCQRGASDGVFLTFCAVLHIICNLLFLPSTTLDKIASDFAATGLILTLLSPIFPVILYLTTIATEKEKLTLQLITRILADISSGKPEFNDLITMKGFLSQTAITTSDKREMRVKFFTEGKQILDNYIKQQFPDLFPYFNHNFVQLSNFVVLERLEKRFANPALTGLV